MLLAVVVNTVSKGSFSIPTELHEIISQYFVFSRLVAPVGCHICSNVAFCTVSCRDEALNTYHKYECKIMELLLGSGVSVLCHLALRMITQKELKENLRLYGNRKKEHVFSLCTNREKRSPKDFFRRTVMASFLLRCLQKVGYFGEEYSGEFDTIEWKIYRV